MQSSRVYAPKEGSVKSSLSGLADVMERVAEKRMSRRSDRESDLRDLQKQGYKEAADTERQKALENVKAQHQKELAELKAKLSAKHGGKAKKFKEPDMLEQFMLTKGHFPAAMKAKTTAKGTPNPFAEYTPEDEVKHIAHLAQLRGFVPDQTVEMPSSHEGGFAGIGGHDIPGRVIQTYKPGRDVGGSIENAEPETETPQEEPTE